MGISTPVSKAEEVLPCAQALLNNTKTTTGRGGVFGLLPEPQSLLLLGLYDAAAVNALHTVWDK